MTNKDLTIVITTFKSEDKIESCLNSIDPSIKVIIIENSNNKKFKEYIENKYRNVDCELTLDNFGYGKSNNIGLSKVKSKYSLILNPDTILKEEAIKKFFTFIEKKINFAILGPKQNDNFSVTPNEKNIYSKATEVEAIEGFAMFLNMEKFLKIGFFDENFFLFLEEIDLCKRIKDINEKVYLEPNIEIFHYGGKSVNKTFAQEIELTRNWHWMWSLFYYNKKHFNFCYALLIIFPKFFSAFFKTIFYTFFLKKKKYIYLKRLSGLINSILGKPSWYRPTLD
tara:strand:+ start:9766 stop:10611 length:846 start_codon:yes stop_codon:yes gene_type:complete